MRKISIDELLSYLKKHQAIIKDRLVFVSIFFVIAIPLAILFYHTGKQSSILEEKKTNVSANNVYLNLSTSLANDFNIENNRPYKVYGILTSIPVIGGNSPQLSDFFFFPDSTGPYCSFDENIQRCRKGLVGHFQISQDNELLTPFYPDTSSDIGKIIRSYFTFEDEKLRKETRDYIEKLLDTLNINNNHPQQDFQALDSSAGATSLNIDQLWNRKNINVPTRTEATSEEEALTYFAETAKKGSSNESFKAALARNPNATTSQFQVKYFGGNLVFFRRLELGDIVLVQGFVVDQKTYLNYILRDLPLEYANNSNVIELNLNGKTIASRGTRADGIYKQSLEQDLPVPFQEIKFQMYYNQTINSTAMVIMLSGIILIIVIAICLFTIYKFTRSKIDLAAKRQDFVSAITHELKTPLAAIKMYAELLQNSWVANEEKRQRYYGQIANESDRLSRLIQNVLNLSKLDGNRWNVQLRMERPKAVIDDFIATYSKNVEKQGFELTVSTDMEADKIHQLIDRDAIMQILMNLVDNSLKFSKNASYKMINIELAIKGTDMYMAIRDYGPGIPPSEMKKVFQEFYRVENEMTRQTNGTGIGLSMVKKLCNLCNMKIEVENANPGLRTKIHFKPLDL